MMAPSGVTRFRSGMAGPQRVVLCQAW
jgi:hypothetical protein